MMQGTCSPSHSLKDNMKGKTKELSGNKTSKASVTRKCLNKGFKIAQLKIIEVFAVMVG